MLISSICNEETVTLREEGLPFSAYH